MDTFLEGLSTEWCLALLSRKMGHAIVFGAGGYPVEPASVLRKRPLLVMRGTFSTPEFLEPNLFQSARRHLHYRGYAIRTRPGLFARNDDPPRGAWRSCFGR
jgi:hypothetical protein